MKLRAESVTEESGQTDCVEFIPPGACIGVAATDTFVQAFSDSMPCLKSAQTTAEAAVVYIPIAIPARDTASRGAKLTSLEVHYDLDVEGTAGDFGLYKVTLAADGTIATVASEIATTCSDTDAELYEADEHTVTLTVTTPAFVGDGEFYYALLSITKKTTTDFCFFGALAHYTRAL